MFRLGKKCFVEGHPPPPHRNSKKLLWPRGGRYASCVHAGGLSCFTCIFSVPAGDPSDVYGEDQGEGEEGGGCRPPGQ